jgi:hypothetical protein
MKITTKILFTVFFVVTIFNLGVSALNAQFDCEGHPFCIPRQPPESATQPLTFINLVADIIFWIGILLGGIAILIMFWSAFLFMVSGDNASRQERAKKFLTWGIIGIIVALFASAIVPLVYNLLAGNLFS